MKRLVHSLGINDINEPVFANGKEKQFYKTWKNMLNRSLYFRCKTLQPTYIECSICDEWLLLSKFKEWFNDNYREGFQLDKDILVEGNKVYSPETCRFVPAYLNKLLTDRRNFRGDLPLGVTENKPDIKSGKVNSTYVAQCSNGYGKQLTKTFKTIEEAVNWYSVTKTRIVKEQAIRAFLGNSIKTDVYLALVRRKF